MTPRLITTVLIFVGSWLCGGWASAQDRTRVLVIGIDGTRPDALQRASTPNIDQLETDGAWSLDITSTEITKSGPAWSTVLTGVYHDKHGVTDNTFVGSNFDRYPHFFSRVRSHCEDTQTGSFIAWAILNNQVPNGASRCNRCALSDSETTAVAADYLAGCDPDLTFVHLLEVDLAGHQYGFSPEVREYLDAIEFADLRVGQILAAVESRPNFNLEDWLTIVVTDHGGTGTGHGGTSPEETGIFMIVSGAATIHGPIEPPPQLVDVAPTILDFLGLANEPAWELDGSSVGLDPNRLPTTLTCLDEPIVIRRDGFEKGLCDWNFRLPECLDPPFITSPFEP